ncbi:MAG TPA: adenylate/guanylate cyclase domain-containing protein [Saprospiraceae bacterium]|nr:adenylate/guanylate cyclase domain-containing protein [Saprospiraceae bacterium]HMQ82864.1 adenylate/guanylate cyclase domain-containing protein [Saprospiraceae bacterium]
MENKLNHIFKKLREGFGIGFSMNIFKTRFIGWIFFFNYFMKTAISTLLLLVLTTVSFAQERTPEQQKDIDSLLSIWNDHSAADTIRINAIHALINKHYLDNQPDSAFYFAQLEFDLAKRKGLKAQMMEALNAQGNSFLNKADYPKALDYYQQSLSIAEELGKERRVGRLLGNIANIYVNMGDSPKALEYCQQSDAIAKAIGDIEQSSRVLLYYGVIYVNEGDFDKALDYFQRSLAIKEELGSKGDVATLLGNIGVVYANKGDFPHALEYFQRNLEAWSELGNRREVSLAYLNLSGLNLELRNYQQAIHCGETGLQIAKEVGELSYEQNFNEQLYGIYKKMGNSKKALEYYEQAAMLKDSLFNVENTRKMARLEMQYDFDKKEAAAQAEQEKKDALVAQQLKQQKLVRNVLMGGLVVVLFFAGVFFRQRNKIEKEKQRSEALLLNILPSEVAEELKQKGEAEARSYDTVSILFTDFKSFTEQSEKMSAVALVSEINHYFKEFDAICEQFGVEKIKTIGDSYMAAGGLPAPEETSVKNTVLAALAMQQFVEKHHQEKEASDERTFQMRVGIHTGPIVAGIVGVKKFQYDVWGDTVNTASRMESSGEVNKVNISRATYELLKNDADFTFESRGKITAKGKGDIEMYFVRLS